MYGTFWALVPPLVAIVLALITKEVFSSLFVGILLGSLFINGFAPVATIDTVLNDGLVTAVADNAGLFVFFVVLGALVALVNMSGGAAAFGTWASSHIKTRGGAMFASVLLGVLIFIDDYFNCLTVGSVMKPVTDTHKVSRVKLAYIIDATAAPICMIAPVSSWAAAVAGIASDMDTGINGTQLFIQAIPYNFYSLLTIAFIIVILLMKFDYGPMRKYEKDAIENGNLYIQESMVKEDASNPKGKVIDLVFPILLLIVTCIFGLIYVGGFFGVDAWGGEDCAGDFIGAFGNTDAFIGLPWGGIIALVITILYMVLRRIVTFKDAMSSITKGFVSMVPAMTILTLAVSLKTMTSNLGAAEFVHDVMEGSAASLYAMLPAVIFVVACFLAFSTGTSWGTFGILIPIVTAIFATDSELFIIGISACLAGAVCGDHCSPISDTTIMASAGAQCDHLNHVSTQIPYAVTVAAISFVTYIFAGFIQNWVISLLIGIALTVVTLFVIRMIANKKEA